MRVKVSWRQTSRENYNKWKETHPNSKLSYVEFQNIIYSFNYAFRDYLLETGDKGKLPWGIGDFSITKYKPKKTKIVDGKEIINLPVDWKATKLLGKKVYHLNRHTEGYKFKWQWFIESARFKMCEIFTFKPSRITSRFLNHYLKQPSYQHIYVEWSLIR